MTREFNIIEDATIPLPDGTTLAARIWMPGMAGADPVPAVLEFLPYRKRMGTDQRDDSTYPHFARSGIAGVRVDIRGSGESEGVIDGEYTPRELADACDVIAWIAAQPWCNGSVGMMGISWGGFNCLQVAALQPPALKAVISIASTVDRYADDIHFKGGCQLSAKMSWAATMQAYQTRAPDPAIVGDRWRDMWLDRLEHEPLFMEEWLSHQRRDDFWKHGSICEDFGAVHIPALVIAGWADGYRNTPLKAVEGMADNAWALIGPWVHKYPHFAMPHPRADFLGMATDWWQQWLAQDPRAQEKLPQLRAYILDGPRPDAWRERDPGRWVALDRWQQPGMFRLTLAEGLLSNAAKGDDASPVSLRSPLDHGTTQGEYFTRRPDAELPGDQRDDLGGALCYETAPMAEPLDLLGAPRFGLRLACPAPWANLAVRLVDIHPDGTQTRITLGVLNLAHRDSHEDPRPMPDGPVDLTITLDHCGYRLRQGHRLGVMISTALWPYILPAPYDPALQIWPDSLTLDLPLLPDHARPGDMPEPSDLQPLPDYIQHAPSENTRRVTRDLNRRETRYELIDDTGLEENPGVGAISGERREECWTIGWDDPNSMSGCADWICGQRRPGSDWDLRTETKVELHCTETDWLVETRVRAFERDRIVFSRAEARRIPRDGM